MAIDRRSFIARTLAFAGAIGLARPRPALAGRRQSKASSRHVDFAIVGAGLFGSAAARHLSQESDSVALIGPPEPDNLSNHEGVFASHYDASRLVRGVDPDITWATLATRSIDRYRQIEKSSGIRFYHQVGYMMVTPGGLGEDWFDLPAMRKVANELSIGIDDLDDGILRERFPYLRFTPGSSAVLQPTNAGYIDPRRLLEAQQTLAVAQGAALHRDVVTDLKRNGDQYVLETASSETLRANRVLVATGAYSNASNLLPKKLDIKVRAAMLMETAVPPGTQVNYPATLYAKTDGEADFWGLLMPPIKYDDGGTYIKTMDGYFGSEPLEGQDNLNAWSRSRGHEDHHRVLQRALNEVYPSLSIGAQRFKPCLIADTASHYPYIDMLDDRLGILTGGNGKAAKSSDEIGKLAAGMIRTQSWPDSLPQATFAARFA